LEAGEGYCKENRRESKTKVMGAGIMELPLETRDSVDEFDRGIVHTCGVEYILIFAEAAIQGHLCCG
jgi:hypothetical protein